MIRSHQVLCLGHFRSTAVPAGAGTKRRSDAKTMQVVQNGGVRGQDTSGRYGNSGTSAMSSRSGSGHV